MTAVDPSVQAAVAPGAGAPAVTRGEAAPGPVPAQARPAPPRRMLLVVNPHAASLSLPLRRRVVAALERRYAVDAIDTQRKGHAIELAREAAGEGYDLVVAFGGDGTVNEVANGLAGSPTPLACLPGGSANVFARILGLPADVARATERLVELADDFRPRAVDLGRVGNRWFTFSAGVGLDASVVEQVDAHPALKAHFRSWYFAHSGVTTFLRRYVVRPPRLEVRAGGRAHVGVSAMVQNAHPYSYFHDRPVDLAEGAQLDSGDLAGVVLTRANPADMPGILWRIFSSRARVADHRRVEAFRGATALDVHSLDGRPLPVQVDGDHIGDMLDARFEVAPAALLVIG
jgi:diacylglycerol kinase family enzyme